MNKAIFRKLTLVVVIGMFSQFSMAQNDGNAAALKLIADIVITINHFPSDDDLSTLDPIIAQSELAQGVRGMANAVANINHTADEEGRGTMEALQSNAQAPERAKVLAGIIENFAHAVSDDGKAELARLFP